MPEALEITIKIESQCGRIDKILSAQLPQFSRSQIQKWITAGTINVNGHHVKAKDQLVIGDVVVIKPTEPKKVELSS